MVGRPQSLIRRASGDGHGLDRKIGSQCLITAMTIAAIIIAIILIAML